MKEELIKQVAAIAWEKNRLELGITLPKHTILSKSWEEMNKLADEGNEFQKVMIAGHLQNCRIVLESFNEIFKQKSAHTMENSVDAGESQA